MGDVGDSIRGHLAKRGKDDVERLSLGGDVVKVGSPGGWENTGRPAFVNLRAARGAHFLRNQRNHVEGEALAGSVFATGVERFHLRLFCNFPFIDAPQALFKGRKFAHLSGECFRGNDASGLSQWSAARQKQAYKEDRYLLHDPPDNVSKCEKDSMTFSK